MSVDPNIDHHARDPEDKEQSTDAALREAEELEARMRRALATKEDPLRDGETTSERLRRLDAESAKAAEAAEAGGEQPSPS